MTRRPRYTPRMERTDAQLAAIFTPQPSLEQRFERYIIAVAMDHLRRAVAAETLAAMQMHARAYRQLNRGLIEAGIWPEG